ncbi:hypothetical protein JTB14_009832 [Gonioctena quinquepunctata]|nr:hypothetical protein JTB14_009832 [Gonioctena quinquepunctata]
MYIYYLRSQPRRLYSPHTTFLRQSGHSFELSTALCSLLIGIGYDAYVVSGYAVKDVTKRIMIRVKCPFVEEEEDDKSNREEVVEEKYKLKPPRDLRSKFLMMMEEKEKEKANVEKEKLAEEERLQNLELEKVPSDDFAGQRVHAWVLLLPGERNVTEAVFIDPSTGFSHPLNSHLYLGIESIWNHTNYWVNMQDCTGGLSSIEYDFTNVEKWEHFLAGEPLKSRKQKPKDLEEEDTREMFDEKHLDMPISWGMKIHIPHDSLKKRFPDGMRTTQYKYTSVEEYAPYMSYDGLVLRITRYKDFDCTIVNVVDEHYENRQDKLYKAIQDAHNNIITDYFHLGREDSVLKHVYYKNQDAVDAERTIFFNSEARFDALCEINVEKNRITEKYKKRDDRLYFRQVTYETKGNKGKTTSTLGGVRRPILKIIQKYQRDENKHASDDIAVREFDISAREIRIKFHYGKGKVTSSTRTFIKPPISEMGEGMVFKPELTYGYQAEIGAKPLRQLNLFILFEQQLKEEENVLNGIRDVEIQISEFLLTRAHEMAFPNLEISIFNREQNIDYRSGMLEREEQQRVTKVKEVEEETDYLAPYIAKLGYPTELSYDQALDAKYACLDDFKRLMVDRANVIQRTFERTNDELQSQKAYYTMYHENLTGEEEALYFEEVNNLITYLRALEIRLQRHKELTPLRYEAFMTYLNSHPLLESLTVNP